MILITGATGQLGSEAVNFLLKKVPASQVAVMVRDESKASDLKEKGVDVRRGNYDEPASILRALEGVEKLLLVSGNDIPNRQKQHENVIEAAKEAGVKHVVYTSFQRKNETATSPLGILATSHIETDKYLKQSGLNYTIMLNGLYADVLPMFFGEKVLETGIFLPAGDGKASYTLRMELAEAAANILSTAGHQNKEYVVTNTENYSFKDAAKILSELTGKQVAYNSPTAESYTDTLEKAGVPAEYIGMLASFSEGIKQGEFETAHTDLELLLGRKPASLKTYFQTVYAPGK